MSQVPLIITTLANERFAPGLGVMVCSALLWADQESVVFYVMDGGMLPSTREKIVRNAEGIAKQRGIEVEFRFLDIERMELPSLAPIRGSLITYARFLLPDLLAESSVYFVDADIVCNHPFPSPREMETNHASFLLAACMDPGFNRLQDDCPWMEHLSEEERQLPYINAGFMWMNLAALREFGFWDRFLQLAATGMSVRTADQTFINYLCRNRILILPPEYNRLFGQGAWEDLDMGCNFHFFGAWKPWMKERDAKSLLAIHLFSPAARVCGFMDEVAATNQPVRTASLWTGCYLKLWFYRLIGSWRAVKQQHTLAGRRWLKSALPAYEARLAARLRQSPGFHPASLEPPVIS